MNSAELEWKELRKRRIELERKVEELLRRIEELENRRNRG